MQISVRRLFHDFITNFKPRELLYWTVGNGIYQAFQSGMRVQLFGVAEHYGPPAPATLILATHKRDWDPILFATSSYYHRGWFVPDGRRVGFAGRADIWDRGFLATVVGYRNWPTWSQHLLDATSFAPLANRLRAYPILRVPEYTLRQYFRALLKEEGDVLLSAVLSLETLLDFTRHEDTLTARKKGRSREEVSPLRLSDVLGWEYRLLTDRPVHMRHLTAARYERLQAWMRGTIEQQLETLAHSMDGGETLWFAPEGAVTLDGRVMRLRSGLQTLLARVRPDTRILPANVTYDFMTNERRMIACLAVGPELSGVRHLDRAEQARQVTQALALQTTVTMSQLGSKGLLACLEDRAGFFDPEAEAPALLADAHRLAKLGAWVQPELLKMKTFHRRLYAFVAYAKAHQLITPTEHGIYFVSSKLIKAASSRYWENPVRYCANELDTLEKALLLRREEVRPVRPPTKTAQPERKAEPSGRVEAETSIV